MLQQQLEAMDTELETNCMPLALKDKNTLLALTTNLCAWVAPHCMKQHVGLQLCTMQFCNKARSRLVSALPLP